MSKIIVALDFNTEVSALSLAQQLNPALCKLKVGKEMFTLFGPALVEKLHKLGFDVFLDLKFHDIPNTVAKACVAAAELGVWMVNVHASGGMIMMETARDAIEKYGTNKPKLIAVTVLTSMEQSVLNQIGIDKPIEEQVLNLASLTQQSGLDGVVCSAQEAKALKTKLGQDFLLVTPGIRPIGSSNDDQSRIVTPKQAIADGSDYLVIGRPITKSESPLQALEAIYQSVL